MRWWAKLGALALGASCWAGCATNRAAEEEPATGGAGEAGTVAEQPQAPMASDYDEAQQEGQAGDDAAEDGPATRGRDEAPPAPEGAVGDEGMPTEEVEITDELRTGEELVPAPADEEAQGGREQDAQHPGDGDQVFPEDYPSRPAQNR